MEQINQRKLAHVNLVANHDEIDRRRGYFDAIQLMHRALPELNLAQVDASTSFLGKPLSFPLLISSMTGGSDGELIRINRHLAEAVEAEGVALAVGSQRVLLADEGASASFELRRCAPRAVLLGNMGAVQLNYGVGLEECRHVMEVLEADGICLHLNPLQEAVQPQGDTDFSGLADKIAAVVAGCGKPVVVKEVGCGILAEDAERLRAAGVRYVDVAGAGGTSWSMVESKRCSGPTVGELLSDWGIPTPASLRMMKPYRDDFTVIASGGIRNGLDMVKCMVLGASVCGLARPFLESARESTEAVRRVIRNLRREFTTVMFLLGAGSVEDIFGREELILNEHGY